MNQKVAYTITGVLSAITALLTALGAFSFKLDYERGLNKEQFELAKGHHQEQMGALARHLTIQLSKECDKKEK